MYNKALKINCLLYVIDYFGHSQTLITSTADANVAVCFIHILWDY